MYFQRPLVLSACALFAHSAFGDCGHRAPRAAEIDATGVRKVVVSAGAGELSIAGEDGTTLVRATGDACANNQKALEAIRLEVRRTGDTVHVEVVMPERDSMFRDASLDLKIAMPAGAALQVHDTSGDIVVSKVAAATIDDSSGDQSIRDIAGDVSVQDSSGDIVIEAVRGNVEVRDSSGEIKVVDVGGNVTIPVDSSGNITLRRIRGDVHILTDSSGDIVLDEINRNVRIDNDSSGDIRASNIGGDFTVAHDSSGGISHRNVLGKVSIPH